MPAHFSITMTDSFRIRGPGRRYVEPLQTAGINMMNELPNRNATNSTAAMQAMNDQHKQVRLVSQIRLASNESAVNSRVAQAEKLTPVVTY